MARRVKLVSKVTMVPPTGVSRLPFGWTSRMTPHPSPDTFNPAQAELVLASFLSAPIGEQLLVALFEPCLAVDRFGKPHVVLKEDFDTIVELARSAARVPLPASGRWRTKQAKNNLWAEKLWVAPKTKRKPMTSVVLHGFTGTVSMLEEWNGVQDVLPQAIFDVFLIIEETKKGRVREADSSMLAQIVGITDGAREA